MKKMFENKKWVALLVLAIVVVAALVIGIWAGVGCSEKDPNPTDAVVTDPTGTTGGNDVTDPTSPNVTDPSDPDNTDPSDPTGTPDNPAQPTDPVKPDDFTDPTDPSDPGTEPGTDPGTEPDDPTVGPPEVELDPNDKPAVTPTVPEDKDDDANEDDLVVEPGTSTTEPSKPPVSTDQFGGVTPSTIRYSDWQSWDRATRQAFYDLYDIENCSPEEYHNFIKASVYKDYECGFEGHSCRTEGSHEALLKAIEKGCSYCGKHDCSSFFVLNPDTLYCDFDNRKCPEYDIKNDPVEYCQDCGLPKAAAERGEICCRQFVVDKTCPGCGEFVKAHECHECIY